jgi:hypothetical protein
MRPTKSRFPHQKMRKTADRQVKSLMLSVLLAVLVAAWLIVPEAVSSEVIIANGQMNAPIRMTSFPAVETLKPERLTRDPDIPRPQIEILVANQAYVFVAIPDIAVRNIDRLWRRRRRNNDWRWSHQYRRRQINPAVWFNDTSSQ